MNLYAAVAPHPRCGNKHVFIIGMVGSRKELELRVSDRIANDEAWPGEKVVRVPRRMFRTSYQLWMWYHGGPKMFPELLTDICPIMVKFLSTPEVA